MTDSPLAAVVRRLRHQLNQPLVENLPDAVLLERFVGQRDPDAFAALVRRHGPLVWRVCRRVLRQTQQAEEAYQTTFLALVQQAAKIRKPAALPSWLYGVAYRIAGKMRASLPHEQYSDSEAIAASSADPADEAARRELEQIVIEEVQALPEKYRLPILLCYWQGLTNAEAAVRLSWPEGTVKTRLLQARQLLHDRLTRRGVSLSAGAFVTLLAGNGNAAVPPILTASAIRMMQALVQGEKLSTFAVSKSMAALAEQAVPSAVLSKGKIVAVLLLGSAFAGGVGVVTHHETPTRQAEQERAARPNEKVKEAEQPKAQAEKPKIRYDHYGDPLPPRAIARLGSLRLYHGQHIHRVILSPDGKWVVSTASDGNRLWDAATGRELQLRKELRGAAIFATRDKLIAVAKQNLDLQLWDIASDKKIGGLLPAAKVGQLFLVLHLGFPSGFSELALSPDGHTLVICNRGVVGTNVQQVLRFCDVVKGKVEEPVDLKRGGKGSESRMVFSADGKTLVVQCDDATIHVWDVARRTEKRRSRSSADDYAGKIALSPDGTILATAPFPGKRIRLWDIDNFKELPPLLKQADEFVRAIAFSPDGKQLTAIPANAPTVHLWDMATRKETSRLSAKASRVLSIIYSADGKYLAAGDGAGITFWDIKNGKFRHDFGHTYAIHALHFSPDGRKLVTSGTYTDKAIRIWDPLSGEETAQLRGHSLGIEAIEYAPDGKLIASASQDGSIRLWDAATGREVRRLETKDGMAAALAFTPDGKIIASGGKRTIQLWDVATGRRLHSINKPGGYALRLTFSPDGKILASHAMGDKYIRFWNAATGEPIRRSARQGGYFAFSPDGRTFANGGKDGTVCLRDIPSGEELRLFVLGDADKEHPHAVFSAAFSPDGRTLAVGYDGRMVRLWEVYSGRERIRFEGHRGEITSLGFSPDGTLLASGGVDRLIMVWDVTGQRTTHLPRKNRLRPEQGNALWNELADADAQKAYRAMQTLLAAGGQTVSLFQERLRPAAAIDRQRIDRRIADLDSDEFAVRQKAAKELREIGEDAEPALRKILTDKPSAEQRLRVKQLLQEIDAARSSEALRGLRVVEVLEHIGTPAAQEVLKTLAKGVPQARLTREAKASLERLAKRRKVQE